MDKKYKIIKLPTKTSRFWYSDITNNFIIYESSIEQRKKNKSINPQHFYILSDEKVKKGDNVLYNDKKNGSCIYNVKSLKGYSENDKSSVYLDKIGYIPETFIKKVIASTDCSLNLHLIHQSYINYYIEEYNKGNVIEEVEMEFVIVDFDNNKVEHKIQMINNTISIKPIKDSWSREEVITLLNKYEKDTNYYGRDGYYSDIDIPSEFIKENL